MKSQLFLTSPSHVSVDDLAAFARSLAQDGAELYRDLPWRNTRDPYAIWLSETMLQQTQVTRVLTRWAQWMDRFPTVEAVAAASNADILEAWQGMGYNRRALNLKRCADVIAHEYGGIFPSSTAKLEALPGIGPATAAGIRSFAFDLPSVYIETNVRSVLIGAFYPQDQRVTDKQLTVLAQLLCPGYVEQYRSACEARGLSNRQIEELTQIPAQVSVRSWYYALLDKGAQIKGSRAKTKQADPARRSAAYSKQSKFEGSHRQKRAHLLRILLDAARPLSTEELTVECSRIEQDAGRPALDVTYVEKILNDLAHEGFIMPVKNACDTCSDSDHELTKTDWKIV